MRKLKKDLPVLGKEDRQAPYDAKKLEKVTVYTQSEFGLSFVKREVKLICAGVMEWAQYKDAFYLKYLEKRKRIPTANVYGYKPNFVICEGWDCPEPDDTFEYDYSTPGMTVKKSKYPSFDPNYKTDFDSMIERWEEKGLINVLIDVREK